MHSITRSGGGDFHFDPAAAADRSRGAQPCSDGRSHSVDNRQESFDNEVERRRKHVVGAAFEHQPPQPVREDEGHQHRLQHRTGGSRRSNSEVTFPHDYTAGTEYNLGRFYGQSLARCIAYGPCSLDRGDARAQ